MDKKSKILIWVFGFLVLISLAFTFYKTVILQDFEVIDTSEYDTNNVDVSTEVNTLDDENSTSSDNLMGDKVDKNDSGASVE